MTNHDPQEPSDPDSTPTVTCSICDWEWSLEYELDELQAGNGAVSQLAMDHYRHTGHYPDGVTPWVVDCLECHDGEQFLRERPARRFAQTHARHTGHEIEIEPPDGEPERRDGR